MEADLFAAGRAQDARRRAFIEEVAGVAEGSAARRRIVRCDERSMVVCIWVGWCREMKDVASVFEAFRHFSEEAVTEDLQPLLR